ncbi:hypothetical protein ABIB08_009111 [Bradyrhizobium sp. RT11b]
MVPPHARPELQSRQHGVAYRWRLGCSLCAHPQNFPPITASYSAQEDATTTAVETTPAPSLRQSPSMCPATPSRWAGSTVRSRRPSIVCGLRPRACHGTREQRRPRRHRHARARSAATAPSGCRANATVQSFPTTRVSSPAFRPGTQVHAYMLPARYLSVATKAADDGNAPEERHALNRNVSSDCAQERDRGL